LIAIYHERDGILLWEVIEKQRGLTSGLEYFIVKFDRALKP